MSEYRKDNADIIKLMLSQIDQGSDILWGHPQRENPSIHSRPFFKQRGNIRPIIDGLPTYKEQRIDSYMRRLVEKRGKVTVLDLGCGTGTAAVEIEERIPGIECYGLTGSTFYTSEGGGTNSFSNAMRLPEDRLLIANMMNLREAISETLPLGVDLVYSYRSVGYVALPALYMLEEIYSILRPEGLGFLDLNSGSYRTYSCIVGLPRLRDWLEQRGYSFEFHSRYDEVVDSVYFQKTYNEIAFPVSFNLQGKSFFQDL